MHFGPKKNTIINCFRKSFIMVSVCCLVWMVSFFVCIRQYTQVLQFAMFFSPKFLTIQEFIMLNVRRDPSSKLLNAHTQEKSLHVHCHIFIVLQFISIRLNVFFCTINFCGSWLIVVVVSPSFFTNEQKHFTRTHIYTFKSESQYCRVLCHT